MNRATSITTTDVVPHPRIGHIGYRTLRRGMAVLITWRNRARQRRRLRELDDHLLSDIGITRVDAEREERKPFWKA